MTPGLPRRPEPPHDPRSLLLNGRLGFRQAALAAPALAAAVDPDCCALTLPRLPSALRNLAEASGSLGGVRPPANVALGPDGGVFLLDRTQCVVKRFDPCDCEFKVVPCLGGEGGGARQVRNPGDMAIACGNLYICDTGLELAQPTDPCADAGALTRNLQAQNHRVSIFSLKGFALRGHLVPPPSEPSWRPMSVAVDSLGRVWVGDAQGKLHRFTPAGHWECSWPVIPAPIHLAIDCRDRIYVIAPGGLPPLVVLDGNASPLTNPPKRPEDVRRSFPRLPFAVDPLGRLALEPFCDVGARNSHAPNSVVVFDSNGDAVELKAEPPAPTFEKAATYRSEALDSGIAQCVWHRIQLFGSIPAGTRVSVKVYSADEPLTDAEVDGVAVWTDCAVADVVDAGGQWDCLVQGDPGRYLWLELLFTGSGSATPAICALVVEFPRISLRRFLPAVFGMEPVSADFTDRFLALFDTPLRRIERMVDESARLFDPHSAPAYTADPRKTDFLSWLAQWLGVALDRNWDVATRRRFLKRAGALFDRRGTLRGLREELLLLLGFDRHAPCEAELASCDRCLPAPRNCGPEPKPAAHAPPPLILEHFCLRRWLRVGAGRIGEDAVLWGEGVVGRTRLGTNAQANVTRLDTTPDPQRDPFLVYANQFSVFVPSRCKDSDRTRKSLENLIKTEAPANARGYLHYVEPRFRIGIQSMLGFDAVVASLPQGVTLGATPLGSASVLTSPPHLRGGPAIALDKEGRIGTTSLLA